MAGVPLVFAPVADEVDVVRRALVQSGAAQVEPALARSIARNQTAPAALAIDVAIRFGGKAKRRPKQRMPESARLDALALCARQSRPLPSPNNAKRLILI